MSQISNSDKIDSYINISSNARNNPFSTNNSNLYGRNNDLGYGDNYENSLNNQQNNQKNNKNYNNDNINQFEYGTYGTNESLFRSSGMDNDHFFEQDPNFQPISSKSLLKQNAAHIDRKRPSTQVGNRSASAVGTRSRSPIKRGGSASVSNKRSSVVTPTFNEFAQTQQNYHPRRTSTSQRQRNTLQDQDFYSQLKEMDAIIQESRLNLFGAFMDEGGKLVNVNSVSASRVGTARRRSNPFPNAEKRYVIVQSRKFPSNNISDNSPEKNQDLNTTTEKSSSKRRPSRSLDPYRIEPFKIQNIPPVQISTVAPKSKRMPSGSFIYFDEEKNKHILTRRPSTSTSTSKGKTDKQDNLKESPATSQNENTLNSHRSSNSNLFQNGDSLIEESVQNHASLFGSHTSRPTISSGHNPMRMESYFNSSNPLLTSYSSNTDEHSPTNFKRLMSAHPRSRNTSDISPTHEFNNQTISSPVYSEEPKAFIPKSKRVSVIHASSLDRLALPRRVNERPNTTDPKNIAYKNDKLKNSKELTDSDKKKKITKSAPLNKKTLTAKKENTTISTKDKNSKSNINSESNSTNSTTHNQNRVSSSLSTDEDKSLKSVQETRMKLLKEFLL